VAAGAHGAHYLFLCAHRVFDHEKILAALADFYHQAMAAPPDTAQFLERTT